MENFLTIILFAFLMSKLHRDLKHLGFKRYAVARAYQHQLAYPRASTYLKYWGIRYGMVLLPALGEQWVMGTAMVIVIVIEITMTILGLLNWVKWNQDDTSIKE